LDLDLPGRVALGATQPAGALAQALLERAPAGLGRVLFTNSGAESVEAAIKVGRTATGRPRVVSVEHGFHGLTLGSLSANGGDAVATGFGRTGRMFACDHWGLEPDVMTVSKALSGGYVPIGACLFAPRVFDAVFDSMEHALSHGSTFAPNDLGVVAGLATIH